MITYIFDVIYYVTTYERNDFSLSINWKRFDVNYLLRKYCFVWGLTNTPVYTHFSYTYESESDNDSD